MEHRQLISPRRMLRVLTVALLACLAVALLGTPVLLALEVTVPLRLPICCGTPASFGAKYEQVNFYGADGVRLSGWYLPPSNGAVIIVEHLYFSDRHQALPVAAMLYKHGYGVLMYDQRASGQSEGYIRSLGALDIPDVARAADWVTARQPGARLGAFGCSEGGGIILAGAASVPAIRALVVDAPSELKWSTDLPPFSLSDPLSRPTLFLFYKLVRLVIGTESPRATADYIRQVAPRPILFISTGLDGEFTRVHNFVTGAPGPVEEWNIPGSVHCYGPVTNPREYEERLIHFFDTNLSQ